MRIPSDASPTLFTRHRVPPLLPPSSFPRGRGRAARGSAVAFLRIPDLVRPRQTAESRELALRDRSAARRRSFGFSVSRGTRPEEHRGSADERRSPARGQSPLLQATEIPHPLAPPRGRGPNDDKTIPNSIFS